MPQRENTNFESRQFEVQSHEKTRDSHRNSQLGTRAISALAICTGLALGLSACSESPSAKIAEQEGGSGQSTSSEVISGADCVRRDDIYQEGLLNLTDGSDNIVTEKLNNLESNITLYDGVSGGNGPRIDEIPADILSQIRASIDQQIDRGEAPSLVNLYGERSSDADDYDSKVNDGLRACTA